MKPNRTRWHILVFPAPAVLVYTTIMVFPLFNTLRLVLFDEVDQARVFVGLDNFRTLFGDPRWSASFWNALDNNLCSSSSTCWCRTRSASCWPRS